jgi:hypothetical protein
MTVISPGVMALWHRLASPPSPLFPMAGTVEQILRCPRSSLPHGSQRYATTAVPVVNRTMVPQELGNLAVNLGQRTLSGRAETLATSKPDWGMLTRSPTVTDKWV